MAKRLKVVSKDRSSADRHESQGGWTGRITIDTEPVDTGQKKVKFKRAGSNVENPITVQVADVSKPLA